MRKVVRHSIVLLAFGPLAFACRSTTSSAVKDDAVVANTNGAAAPPAAQPALELGEVPFSTTDANGNVVTEDQWIQRLVAQSDTTVAASKTQTGTARRSAHAKTHACVTATFTVLPERPAEARVGIFENEGTFPAWVRFSNSVPSISPDTSPAGRGMAVKVIFDNGEARLLPGHEQSNAIDFPFVSGPIFPVRNLQDYLSIQENGGKFLATHPREAALAAEIAGHSTMESPLNGSYWSMGAFKVGTRAAKLKMWPCQKTNSSFSIKPNFMRNAIIKTLMTDAVPACFVFGVQWQGQPTSAFPVEDPSVEWDDTASPFIPIARIDIPAQTFTNPKITDLENRGSEISPQDDFCERLSFNPWRTLAIQHPLGNLLRARREVYAHSLSKRLELNGADMLPDQLTGTQDDVPMPTGN